MLRRPSQFSLKSRESRSDSSMLIAKHSDDFYVKGPETIEIFKDGQKFSLEMESFRKNLRKLYEKWNVKLYSLGEDKRVLDEIMIIMAQLYNEPDKYDTLMKEIRQIFGKIKDPQPQTVAARLVGCFSDDISVKNRGCDPKCTSSLKPTSDIKDFSPCEDMVLVLENGKFFQLNRNSSEHAYISASPSDVFTDQIVKQLEEASIKKVTIMYTSEDGQKTEVKGPIPVESLYHLNKDEQQKNDDNNGWAITFIVLIVVLILLAAWLIYYTGVFN